MLRLGIIGLPQSGKTTVFNALSGSHAAVGDYSTSKNANLAMVKVPDERLDRLVEIFKPKKITPAEIEYIDIAGMTKDASTGRKKEAEYVRSIRECDSLLQVVRVFENPNVPHPDSTVDAERDIANVDSELILSDLILIETRMIRIEKNNKVAKKDQEMAELKVLAKLKECLENEKPLRSLELDADELKGISNYGFLSLKPMLYILNIGEDQLEDRDELEKRFAYLTDEKESMLETICGSLQMDFIDLDDDERQEFMTELGIEALASDKIIRKSFELLGMIAFLTGGEPEVHSWPIRQGTDAQNAAGEIHSDIQRGFIKAEVVKFDDLDELGSWSKARDVGKLQLNGRQYIIQDGDVILFMFNV